MDNGEADHSNFGLGGGESGYYPDWDQYTYDSGDDGDIVQVLLFGR